MSCYGFAVTLTADGKSGQPDICAHQMGGFTGVHSELFKNVGLNAD